MKTIAQYLQQLDDWLGVRNGTLRNEKASPERSTQGQGQDGKASEAFLRVGSRIIGYRDSGGEIRTGRTGDLGTSSVFDGTDAYKVARDDQGSLSRALFIDTGKGGRDLSEIAPFLRLLESGKKDGRSSLQDTRADEQNLGRIRVFIGKKRV
jgi:hypothetical protein